MCVPSLRAALWIIGSLAVMLLMVVRVSYGVPHLWAAEESFHLKVTSRTTKTPSAVSCPASMYCVITCCVRCHCDCAHGCVCCRRASRCAEHVWSAATELQWPRNRTAVCMAAAALVCAHGSQHGYTLTSWSFAVQPPSRSMRWFTAAPHAVMLSHTADRA